MKQNQTNRVREGARKNKTKRASKQVRMKGRNREKERGRVRKARKVGRQLERETCT